MFWYKVQGESRTSLPSKVLRMSTAHIHVRIQSVQGEFSRLKALLDMSSCVQGNGAKKWNFDVMMQDEKLSQFILYLMIDITQTRLTRSDGCIWKTAPDSATLRRSITKPTEQLFTPSCEHKLSFLLPFFFLFCFFLFFPFLYLFLLFCI